MNSNLLLLSLLVFCLFFKINSSDNCDKTHNVIGQSYDCGSGCTGTPPCGPVKCGNVDDMCYCFCKQELAKSVCKTSELGYKWNDGVKLANGSYALNGTKGDGKAYEC
jgi:hypothetical protein